MPSRTFLIIIIALIFLASCTGRRYGNYNYVRADNKTVLLPERKIKISEIKYKRNTTVFLSFKKDSVPCVISQGMSLKTLLTNENTQSVCKQKKAKNKHIDTSYYYYPDLHRKAVAATGLISASHALTLFTLLFHLSWLLLLISFAIFITAVALAIFAWVPSMEHKINPTTLKRAETAMWLSLLNPIFLLVCFLIVWLCLGLF